LVGTADEGGKILNKKDRTTIEVSASVFREVYDSPASLPGRERWTTSDEDVRRLEDLIGLERGTIGVPLWVSGDERQCPKCSREVSWLDIVASSTGSIHSPQMIAAVILGERKYVNVEAPRAIERVACFECGTSIVGLRSFKCHNWAYAVGDLRDVLAGLPKDST
jgi:hypothetical protein